MLDVSPLPKAVCTLTHRTLQDASRLPVLGRFLSVFEFLFATPVAALLDEGARAQVETIFWRDAWDSLQF